MCLSVPLKLFDQKKMFFQIIIVIWSVFQGTRPLGGSTYSLSNMFLNDIQSFKNSSTDFNVDSVIRDSFLGLSSGCSVWSACKVQTRMFIQNKSTIWLYIYSHLGLF